MAKGVLTRLAFLAALVSCGGGAGLVREPSHANDSGYRDGPLLHESKVPEYTKLNSAGRLKEALDVIREEARDPAAPQSDSYVIDVNTIAITGLANFAMREGFKPEYDAEMRRYADTATKLVLPSDVTRRARIAHATALYYSYTGRNGMGLPFFFEEIELWEKAGNKFQTIVAYDGIAAAFGDSGKIEQRDAFRKKALDLAAQYFRGPKDPSDAQQWVVYLSILQQRMDDRARAGGAAELEPLWGLMEPILARGVTLSGPQYLSAAGYFALAGDNARSKALYDKGAALSSPKARPDVAKDVLACPRAQILTFQKQYADAKAAWVECDEVVTRRKLTREASMFRLRAVTLENLGEFDAALEQYRLFAETSERTRGSFTIAQRAAFFRTIAADGHYGIIRVLARKAEKAGDEVSAFAALKASENVRARQFGELLDVKGRGSGGLESLAQLRDRLGPHDALVDLVVMNADVVVFAVTKTQLVVRVIPIDDQLPRDVRAVVHGLATPGSSIAMLDQKLAAIGKRLLSPIRSALAGKTRWIVLPDGILNAIPFDLLHLDGGRVIDDVTVEISPSIAYYLRKNDASTAAKGFFGVADPVYPRQIRVGDRTLAAKDFGGKLHDPPFPALPETRGEMDAVSALFKGEPVETLLAERATESNVKNAALSRYRFLHFATHGVLGNQVPTLDEPALVLADEPGQDAFLTSTDAEQLKLNAELTVLSACNTGSGEYLTGEGVLGMSRAFLLAGSRSVLVSLWSVDSLATELLIVDFYKRLHSGADAASALRAAKMALRAAKPGKNSGSRGLQLEDHLKEAGGSLQHPYFWSAFILVGNGIGG